MPPKPVKGKGAKDAKAKQPVEEEDPTAVQFKKLFKTVRQRCTDLAVPEPDTVPLLALFKKVIGAEEPVWPNKFIFPVPLSPLAVEALCSALEQSRYDRLSSFCFWSANITDAGVVSVSRILRYMPRLKRLELRDCLVTAAGCESLGCELGRSGSSHILHLNLDHNQLGADGIRLLADGLAHHATLKSLSLSHCSIPSEGAADVARILLTKDTALSELNLEGNQLCNSGACLIAEGIEFNRSLASLNLGLNFIGCEHEHSLPDAVDLRVQLLNCSTAESAGAVMDSVFGPICNDREVEVKYAEGNHAVAVRPSSPGERALQALMNSFNECTSLKRVDMNGNLIGDRGAKIIQDSLPDCPNVYFLNISPAISKERFSAIAELCKLHKPKEEKKKSTKVRTGKKKKKS